MVYTNTYSKHHKTGDQLAPNENIFDCAWELQAQRELMASKKFDASILNNIARKCFFFRTAQDKFAEAQASSRSRVRVQHLRWSWSRHTPRKLRQACS